MRAFIKKFGVVFLLLSVLLTSCGKPDAGNDGDKTNPNVGKTLDLNGYTIVRGEKEDQDVITAISSFYSSLKSNHNVDVSFAVAEHDPESDREILFGATNRSEGKNHRYSDYSIDHKDGKLYIDGGSADAIGAACEWLLANCIADGVASLEKLPYEYRAQYSLENLKVFDIPLSEFSIEESSEESVDKLQKWLGSRTGMRRVSENGYVIRVVADKALNFDEIGIELVGKELLLSASAHLGDLSVVTDYFLDAIKTRSSDELTFNRREQIEMPEPIITLEDIRSVNATSKLIYAETDKDPLAYKIGDDVVFACSLYADNKLVSCPHFSWTANTADGQVYMGESDGAFGKVIVKIPATAQGVIRLKVLAKDENGALISEVKQDLSQSVVVNADEVTTHKQEPNDFDEFWASQVAKVTAISPDVISMEKVSSPSGIQCLDGAVSSAASHDFYRVKIKTPDECGYAVGYLTIPKNAKPNSLGITVVFNGYGVSDLSPYISSSNIVLNVCAHSIELGRASSYYSNLLANYGFTGNENRDTSYFRTMIMRDLQAVRFIKAYAGTEGVSINGAKSSLGIWNGKLKLYGGSQGAFQGVAVAALDKDVTDAYWYIPWMCDVGGTASEFRPKYTDDLRYFDTVYFGRRIDDKVNITLTAGLGDYICPPSGVVALFNEMGGHVTMYFKQGMTHGFTPDGAATTIYQK